MRKVLGLLVAVLALAGAAMGSRTIDATRRRSVLADGSQAATAAAQRAADGLMAVVADLRAKADNAAANPRLGFALQGNVDERTMRDLWRTEDWWRPWRTEFKVYAVSVSGTHLDIVEGIDAADLDAEALLRRVRDKGDTAAEFVVGKGWPYAATATIVRVAPHDSSPLPLLVLAKPVDQALLGNLAGKTRGAVAVTDGRRTLLDAGAESERALLASATGSEATGVFQGPQGKWAAAVISMAPGLWLWSYASSQAAADEARAKATERKVMLWMMGGLAAGVALAMGLRRPRSADAAVAAPPAGPPLPSPPPPTTTPDSRLTEPDRTNPPPGSRTEFGTGRTMAAAAAPPTGQTPAPVTAAPVESTFGRYTLLDRLGEGGMAEVYTAVTFGAEGFRRKFVIKRLRAELVREPSVVDQFIDEANMASSMVHSNIVPVFDFGKVGDEYFMAQEYILGRDLARLTGRSLEVLGAPVPPDVMLYVAHETLKGLEYAHAKSNEAGGPMGIVHRDVSPANIIVSSRGEVKLFDFGIVKAEGRVTKTKSGVVKGNITFMSPEQARGMEVDARSDLFSMGLVIYYCLTGSALYVGGTTYELLVKAATGPGPDEFALVRSLPEPCDALLMRALQVSPDDRFQTAREFRDAVAAHIGDGATRLATLMNQLFHDDFQVEEARFRRFIPTPPPTA